MELANGLVLILMIVLLVCIMVLRSYWSYTVPCHEEFFVENGQMHGLTVQSEESFNGLLTFLHTCLVLVPVYLSPGLSVPKLFNS